MFKHLILALVACSVAVGHLCADHPVQFQLKLLTVDANEGCDIADIDDGRGGRWRSGRATSGRGRPVTDEPSIDTVQGHG